MAPPPLLPRRQLLQRLEHALEGRLVRVCAGAGAGKSTLIRLAARRWPREIVHLRLDHRSADASFFFWQLLDALGLEGGDLMPDGSPPLETVGAIAEALTRRPPCVIALDEAELIRSARPVLDIIARLARQAPAGTSLLVLSRDPLALPLAPDEPVADLDERDLALSEDEIAALLREVAPAASAQPATLARVVEVTRARALLVSLFAIAARHTESARLLGELAASDRPVDVLLAHVLAPFPAPEVEALEAAAVLDTLPPDVAGEVAGDAVAWPAVLERASAVALVDDHVAPAAFPRSVSDALRRRLDTRPDAKRAAHRRAAAALRARHDPERVLHHLIEAGDIDEAVQVLITEGLAVVTFNRILALERLLERLPPDRVEADPVLRFARGTVRIVGMDVAGALGDLRAAAEASEAAGLLDVADAARVRLGLTAMFHADFDESVAQNRIVAGRRSPDDAIGMLAFANLELGLRNLGRNDEADEIAARIDASPLEFPDRLPVLGGRCFAARLRGDPAAQRALGLQGAAAARRHHAPGGLCFLLLHVAEGTLALGNAEEALEVAEEAIAICRSMREHWWEIVARQSRLRALAALGRTEEARREAREVIAACDAYGGLLWTRTEAALTLAELPGGDPDAALELAREITERASHPALRAELQLALARRALAKTAPTDAHRALDAAMRELGSVDAPELRQAIRLARAGAWLAEGRSREARESLAGTLHSGASLERERDALAPVLVALALEGDAVAREATLALGARALPHLGRRRSRASEALREEILDASAGPLDVRSLGSFQVVRRGDAGEPDRPIEFRTPRVARLFQTLLVRSAQRNATSTDLLVDRLWPDQDPDAARKSLHTHLSWLRRALEPELPHRAHSRYVQRDDAGYRLDLRGGHWDAEEFRQAAERALRAYRSGSPVRADALLTDALPLHAGRLAADDGEDELWIALRSALDTLFREAGLAGARLALELSKPEVARDRLERLVAADPSLEAAWALRLRAAAALGQADEIPALLARCRDALRRELDAEPSAETLALAERLAASASA